jgi:acyl transferase domain-containing protein/NAD(P)-dependent dehydrogenase (short-subunit alcohol dehydrogenase family)/acyl carrier protein
MSQIAIVGMAALFPRSDSLKGYWRLLRAGKDGITDVPPSHWRTEDYFDPDPRRPDFTYCRRGGFLSAYPFDPTEFQIPPSSLEATDTSQLLALAVAREALQGAGYLGGGRPLDRERTAVILGVTGTLELVIPLGARLGHPLWRRALRQAGVAEEVAEEVVARIADGYVGWQENSFPGLLGNVVAGRIANRLDLRGTNCVVDAACASSLAALHLGVLELETGRSDMVISGGVDTFNDIFMYMCFSKTPALSPSQEIRPFDEQADGTLLGEGVGILLLKRQADAERDGDRIYAVIRGVGTSSDGSRQAIYAPYAPGQEQCLRRAYAAAGVSPATVGLVEAHGTGTRVGDVVEFTALKAVFSEARPEPGWCALGSVKAQVGHTKAAAGAAGLVKAALALHHKVLPATLKVTRPNPRLEIQDSPFYLNTETRPWLTPGHPRRAGVSSFGFGGSNYHVVLEEHGSRRQEPAWDGSVDLAACSASTPEGLRQSLLELASAEPGEQAWRAFLSRQSFDPRQPCRAVLVLEEGASLGELARQALAGQTSANVHLGQGEPGKLALLFPGQGSQYPGMARELACIFPEVLEALEEADAACPEDARPGPRIYPPPVFDDEARRRQSEELTRTQVAQPALGAVESGWLRVLRRFGVEADFFAGHSYGELVALHAAGRLSAPDLFRLSRLRGELMAGQDRGAMVAVAAPLAEIEAAIEGLDVVLANRNSPRQGVLSGRRPELEKALARLSGSARWLPVSGAFHSPLMESAREPFARALQEVPLPPGGVVYAGSTGRPYPEDQEEARRLLAEQLLRPVDFVGLVEGLYQAGSRIFVETGPRTVLRGLVRAILGDRPHQALCVDESGAGLLDLARVLARLAALGVPVALAAWEDPVPEPRKRRLEIPLVGANYRAPRAERPPRPATTPRPTPACPEAHTPVAGSPAPASPGEHAPGGGPAALAIQRDYPHNGEPPARASREERPPDQGWSPPLSREERSPDRGQSPPLPREERPPDQGWSPPLPREERPPDQGWSPPLPREERQPDGGRSVPALRPSPPAPPAPAVSGGSTAMNTPAKGEHSLPPQPTPAPWQQEIVAQALQALQSGMAALQELQRQTAAAHLRFLEGQETAQRSFLEALAAQQRFLAALSGGQVEPLAAGATLAPTQAPSTPSGQVPVPPAPALWQTSPAEPVTAVLPATPAPAGSPASPMPLTPPLLAASPAPPASPVLASSPAPPASPVQASSPAPPASPVQAMWPCLTSPTAPSAPPSQAPAAPSLAAPPPSAAPPAPKTTPPGAPAADLQESETSLATVLLEVVASRTGYPLEMLNLSQDLESELGVDSIKRVEILAALGERIPGLPEVEPEALGRLRTLQQVVDYLHERASWSRNGRPAASPSASPVPAPAAPPALETTPPGAPGANLQESETSLATVLLEVVASRTGYPLEMLNLSQDLEGELGVDSIKRVEILAALGERIPGLPEVEPEALGRLRTLQQVVDYLTCRLQAQEGRPSAPVVERRPLRALVAPPAMPAHLPVAPDHQILVTEDPDGLGAALVEALGPRGRLIPLRGSPSPAGPVGGLILVGRAGEPAGPAWGPAAEEDLLAAFLLARSLAPALQQAARRGGALLATVSRLDGRFGLTGRGFDPAAGGLAGLPKVAALEWPGVTCRALDVRPGWPPPEAARAVLAELSSNGPLEVGLDGDQRIFLAAEPAAAEPGSPPLAPGEVLLVTGGARGITARCALALARAWRPTLVLLGRSAEPFDEPPELAAARDAAALKRALFEAEKRAGRSPSPAEVEAACRRYLVNREIRATLADLAAAGVQARYLQADVRQRDSLERALQQVRAEIGPIRGLVHGAGVLADRRLEEKTAEQFASVLETKVTGLRHLLELTEGDELKVLALFSSVTARFGRPGQVDYAMANEVLNKAAWREAVRRPGCRVVALGWGPWDGGMVDSALRAEFLRLGLGLVPLEEGSLALVAELASPGPAEVLLGVGLPATGAPEAAEAPGPAGLASPGTSGAPEAAGPAEAPRPRANGRRNRRVVVLERELTLERHPFLDSHRLSGRPVLPLAVAVEWLGHAALHPHPGLRLAGLDDLRVLRPAPVSTPPLRLKLVAHSGPPSALPVELASGPCPENGNREVVHVRATAVLAAELPQAPTFRGPWPEGPPIEAAAACREHLFHGPHFLGIRALEACGPRGLVARVACAPAPEAWMVDPPRSDWLADPLALDCALQMGVLWTSLQQGTPSLPSGVGSYRQYLPFPRQGLQAVLWVLESRPHRLLGEVTLLDGQGVVARLEGVEWTVDASLKRAFQRGEAPVR